MLWNIPYHSRCINRLFFLVEISVQPTTNYSSKMPCPKCLDLHPCWLCSKNLCRLGKGRLLRWNPSSCGPCIDLATMCTSLVMADLRKATEGSKTFTKGLSASLKKVGGHRVLARQSPYTGFLDIPEFKFVFRPEYASTSLRFIPDALSTACQGA